MSVQTSILMVTPPPGGLWPHGYTVHKGHTPESLNHATVAAATSGIIPSPELLSLQWNQAIDHLTNAKIEITFLPYPQELLSQYPPDYDGIFIRDVGMFANGKWVKAHFAVPERQREADTFARLIEQTYHVEIVDLPPGADLECGEVFFVKTPAGSYYFGGLGRSNKAGHDAMLHIIKPDHIFLLETTGFHLDTTCTPLIDSSGHLVSFMYAPELFSEESKKHLSMLEVPLIALDPKDTCGIGENLGNMAVNGLSLPGIFINAEEFNTPGVEAHIASLGIARYSSPLPYFHHAGGSYHCLTNEVRL
ncbi:MAG: hypothetical protein CO029_00840 [Candidatus Magasanikbacteria bacterium CG_4_9_14_0_2_um_filter_41_10]|uniref:Amidinotransferase n=1 Tax=Candidatus Magasanikbacteria bacterium CG_4_10_14_0_2_um_filter_41_31 TaxID=1974639 RepID=A0A2M7V2B2_9BACT|nr:MAG: hypothetical protein AUJ37_02835 [Candidatus Magasanikbacteria bacterium CG1_02_41_34]PIZ92557.1 MAG: hypothetical protein COX83_04020 [Candidatus Magasanikbacteria bacterium CG_4_10_14_0_2_um_filter_41_31]PJC53803.1 MAG: hypothetical protein CO029_00840 [Candidatus Magasanikbacteria bacterium CG_4_9_14_0_2_um_filter_41_10]